MLPLQENYLSDMCRAEGSKQVGGGLGVDRYRFVHDLHATLAPHRVLQRGDLFGHGLPADVAHGAGYQAPGDGSARKDPGAGVSLDEDQKLTSKRNVQGFLRHVAAHQFAEHLRRGFAPGRRCRAAPAQAITRRRRPNAAE